MIKKRLKYNLKKRKSLELYKIFWRCFFVQGSWNFKSLLGLGFCYCALPIMRRVCKNEQEQEAFLRRHLQFFNAHPYFCGWGLGAVAKLEEEAIRKRWHDQRPIILFKERLTGPLGAIGDKLFWVGIKPAAAGLAVIAALTCGWFAIPLFLLVYNIPHVYMRLKGINQGYCLGFDIVSMISMRKFQKIIDAVFGIGAVIGGLNFMTALRWTYRTDQSQLPLFIIAAALTTAMLYLKKSVQTVILTITGVAIGYGFMLSYFF